MAPSIIAFTLSDEDWMECMSDIEDLQLYDVFLRNMRYRIHLTKYKRMLGWYHLQFIN